MKFIKNLVLASIVLTALTSNAQLTKKEKSHLYFQEAKKYYKDNDYENALFFIKKIEDLCCITNATLLDLKMKTYFKLDSFNLAKKTLLTYENCFLGTVNDRLTNETLSYFAPIERGIDSLRKIADQEEIDNKNKQVKKIINGFQLDTCPRCLGKGELSLTELYYGNKPWWKKDKCIPCEVCNATGTVYGYAKNDSILNMTEKEFIKLHLEEISNHFKTKNK
jgi:hypothetical protein